MKNNSNGNIGFGTSHSGIAIPGPSTNDLFLHLKDEDYLSFAKIMNSGTSLSHATDRINLQNFKKGLLKSGIVNREDDAMIICLEINSNGGDLLLSQIRGKIIAKDPKLSNLLKRYIRIVLENQQGSTRDRVLGKIISRAGESMTPELNLLRSPMNAYKYVDGEPPALLDKDEVIDVIPVHPSTVETNPSNQRSHPTETPAPRNSIHLPPHSSSRDRVLGKIITNAVSTALEKSATPQQPNQPPPPTINNTPVTQELTPRAPHHHSSRDKVLVKIISNALGAAAGGTSTQNNETPTSHSQVHFPSIAQGKHSHHDHSKSTTQLQKSMNSNSNFNSNSHSERTSTNGPHYEVAHGQDEGDCALQDYTDDQPLSHRRKSFTTRERAQNQTTSQDHKSESRRRVTYDPEKHSSFYQTSPSNEYFQVDLMTTENDNRHILEKESSRNLSKEDSRPRRHSENSICDNPDILEQMKSARMNEYQHSDNFQYQPLPHSSSKMIKPVNAGTGRVRNKILHRMVNRVKETIRPPSETENLQRPPRGPQEIEYTDDLPVNVKEKSQSPTHGANGKWFQNKYHGSTVAVDISAEQKPFEPTPIRDNNLRIQTMESKVEEEITGQHHLPKNELKTDKDHKEMRSRIPSSPNPLRNLLPDSQLSLPSASSNEGSFSPGNRFSGKSSPLHLNVSTPVPHQEMYRRTVNLHHSPQDRALTPEPDAESYDGNDEKSSEWKHEDKDNSSGQHTRDKWVGAVPVQGSSGDQNHRNRTFTSR